jgi:hypothetical protein
VKRWSGARRGTAIACCNSHDGAARPHETEAVPPEARKEDSIREIRRDCRGAGKFPRGFHRLLGEMARMQGVAARLAPREKVSSLGSFSALARVTRPFASSDPRITGIIARRHRDATGAAHILCGCASTDTTGTSTAGGRPILDVAGQGYPRKHEAGARGETQGR